MNNEKYIITQIVINHRNYYVYREQHYFNEFKEWMLKLQDYKKFNSIQETINYYQAGNAEAIAI